MATGGTWKYGRGKAMSFMEGTHNVEAISSALLHREIPYVHPWWEGAPRVHVHTAQRYTIPQPHIPAAVAIEGSLVDKVYKLRFVDHDLQDENKFPDFRPQYFMKAVVIEKDNPLELQFQQWALGLETSKITNLMDIPHFGHNMKITYCVKSLLSCVHGGYLWLDPKVSIDVELIHYITRLLMDGEDPTSLFVDKHSYREVAT